MKKINIIFVFLIVLSLILGACATPTPEVIVETVEVEKEVIETVEVEKEVVVTEVVEVEKVVEVTPVPEEMEPVTLRIAWWGSENRTTRTIAAIKLFEQKYPWITIEYEFAGWDDHWTRLATQAAGGNLPDIMQHDYARLQEWVQDGLVIPLDPFAEDGTLDFSNVADATLSGGRVDGKLYGVPLGTNSLGFVLDLDAFEAAGVDLPANDWTWADFEQIVMDINANSEIWGNSGPLHHDHLWKAVYQSNGEWVFSDDGTALGYEDDQVFIDHLNMILRLQDAGAIQDITAQTEETALGAGVEGTALNQGLSAMQFMWSNQLVAAATAAGPDRNFKMVLVPRVEGGGSANYVKPSMFWSITRDAAHPEEAALFIDFFTNSIPANEILLAERGVPISSEVQEALKPLLEPAAIEMFDFMALVEQNSIDVPPPDPPGWADVRDNAYYPEFVDPALYGVISAEEGAAIFRDLANDILGSQ